MEAALDATEQVLNDPVDWGVFQNTNVQIMTPPADVLQRAFGHDVQPTEIAYVVVVGERQHRPRYRLVIEDDYEDVQLGDTDVSISVASTASSTRETSSILDEATLHQLQTCELCNQHSDNSSSSSSCSTDGESCSDSHKHQKEQKELGAKEESQISASEQRQQQQEDEVSKEIARSALLSKLAATEKRERNLQRQLTQHGMKAVTEDIPYETCKQKIAELAKQMNDIDGNHPDYFKLEQQMELYTASLLLTDEYQAEQEQLEMEWQQSNRQDNYAALRKVRRHMPVDVRKQTVEELIKTNENGKALPKSLAKRFKRTDVLTLIRMDPHDIERMHPSTLESMRVTGLTLTERRALHHHLSTIGKKWQSNKLDSLTARKYKWFCMMKNNFKESLQSYQFHVKEYGNYFLHMCNLVGRSCPVKADAVVDYSGDYGYPEGDVYEESNLLSQKSLNEKQQQVRETTYNRERLEEQQLRTKALKEHYCGRILEMTQACASCEAMDELVSSIDENLNVWQSEFSSSEIDGTKMVHEFDNALKLVRTAVQGIAQRAGLEISGGRRSLEKTNDTRSWVETTLAEKLHSKLCIYLDYMESTTRRSGYTMDNRILTNIALLYPILNHICQRNIETIQEMSK